MVGFVNDNSACRCAVVVVINILNNFPLNIKMCILSISIQRMRETCGSYQDELFCVVSPKLFEQRPTISYIC